MLLGLAHKMLPTADKSGMLTMVRVCIIYHWDVGKSRERENTKLLVSILTRLHVLPIRLDSQPKKHNLHGPRTQLW